MQFLFFCFFASVISQLSREDWCEGNKHFKNSILSMNLIPGIVPIFEEREVIINLILQNVLDEGLKIKIRTKKNYWNFYKNHYKNNNIEAGRVSRRYQYRLNNFLRAILRKENDVSFVHHWEIICRGKSTSFAWELYQHNKF